MAGIPLLTVAIFAMAASATAGNNYPPKPTLAKVIYPECQRNTCPPVDSKRCTVHLPHKDCTKYYKCAAGNPIEQDCPFLDAAETKRLHFNAKEQVCDWPALAGCIDQHETLTPHEWDCTRYYKELNGVKKTQKCPQWTYFSQAKKTCVDPKLSNCTPKCPPAGSNDVALLPHEASCSMYYKCEKGVKLQQFCPKGYHFSIGKGHCDLIANARCTEESECEPSGWYPIPHPTRCDQYYQCDDGVKIVRDCPTGLQYSNAKHTCVLPEDSDCHVLHNDFTSWTSVSRCTFEIDSEVSREQRQRLTKANQVFA